MKELEYITVYNEVLIKTAILSIGEIQYTDLVSYEELADINERLMILLDKHRASYEVSPYPSDELDIKTGN